MKAMSFLKENGGYALVATMALVVICMLGGSAYLFLGVNDVNLCGKERNSIKAFYLAEAGAERALVDIKDNTMQSRYFRMGDISSFENDLDGEYISTSIQSVGGDIYRITASSTVGASTRTIKADVLRQPPARVFDYSYFINNWGSFYGSGITSNGDVRSNGRFDFRFSPTVNGDIYAGQDIAGDVSGTGALEENQHPFSPIVDMPNLENLGYYQNVAVASSGSISISGSTVVDAIYGDDAGETGNIVLIGTPSDPIEVDGPVVITENLIISGTVTGQGTIYAGSNIYLAGNIEYLDGPSSPRPASDDPAVVDAWVNANKDKDLVGLAARESVIVGDYTNSPHYGYFGADRWYADNYIFNMGDEDVGRDGIPDTGDEDEGNGTFEQDFEDLDDDGVYDGNYGWSDIEIDVPLSDFNNLPPGTADYTDISTNFINNVNAIVYTNHAIVGRFGYDVVFNGAVISKDEAMIIRDNITFNHDARIHSRYRVNPNWLIDLNLPLANKVEIIDWWEE
jgi:hypothetical protein